MPISQEPHPWVKGATYVLALVLPIAVGGLATFYYLERDTVASRDAELARRIGVCEQQIAGFATLIAETHTGVAKHEREAQIWIDKIKESEMRIHQLERVSSERTAICKETERRLSRIEGKTDLCLDRIRGNTSSRQR